MVGAGGVLRLWRTEAELRRLDAPVRFDRCSDRGADLEALGYGCPVAVPVHVGGVSPSPTPSTP